MTVAGVPIACTGTGLKAGRDAAISIRQHEIHIDRLEPEGERQNVLPAVVARNVFLGHSRDYMVEIRDGTQLRVVTSPEENIAPGSEVWLRLPAQRCQVLQVLES
jgi:iron(III) transport system ATP-binding protein